MPLLLLWSLFQFFLPVYQSGTKESMQAYRHPVSSASLLLMGIQQLVYVPLYIWTYLALPHFHYIVGILIFQLACVGTLFAAALYVFGSPTVNMGIGLAYIGVSMPLAESVVPLLFRPNRMIDGFLLVNGNSIFDFDTTKLSVHTLDIGLAGIEVYDILRDEYDIQIEFGDIGNILAYLSIGDRAQEVERLVSALAEIRRRFQTDGTGLLSQEYIDPQVVTSPQEAFYAEKCSLPLRETEGHVCSEFVMCYPPGIPIVAPGERITSEILDYIEYAKTKGCNVTGPEDPDIQYLNVLA